MIVAALTLLVLAGGCFTVRAIVGPSLADRVIALDGLVATIVIGILIDAVGRGRTDFLDVALVVGFVGFVATIASARFVHQRGG